MATQALTVLNPVYVTWWDWCATVVNDLRGAYTLPNPVPEGLWQLWATELLNIPGLSDLGLPDPRTFEDDWRLWAAAFTMAST